MTYEQIILTIDLSELLEILEANFGLEIPPDADVKFGITEEGEMDVIVISQAEDFYD